VKPPEVKQEQAVEAPAIAPVAASEAAAPRKIDKATEKSDTPRGQNIGLSRLDRVAIENWQRDLMVHINRFKRYPAKARDSRENGTVMVSFAMDRKGQVVRSAVAKSTGFAELDQAAIDMLQRASPLPSPPANVVGETLEFAVPVQFRWRD
jgi:protein TonB